MFSRSKKYFDLEIVSKSLILLDKNTKYRAQKPKKRLLFILLTKLNLQNVEKTI